ncbi:MAG TPA: Hsp20/alpha crystallin family protein [Methanoregulaceae archaeon]|nr:Hsp20/alpha crystallin family protein [Methanoregulaceae archaeon]
MVTWYYPSVFDELEDMRRYIEWLNRQMYGTTPAALLPAPGEAAIKMLPVQRAILHVNISENDDELVVTAAIIAGITKKDIALHLINPLALEMSCERKEERIHEIERYYLHGRNFESVSRVITLPEAVTEDGAFATFANDVLEVHLKKTKKNSGGKIPID